MSRARLLLAAVLSAAVPSWAGAGKAGFEFLAEAPGARATALGGAASSFADDAEASLSNPAALAELRQRQVSVGYSSQWDGLAQGSLVYGHPLAAGALGAAVRTLDSGDIPAYDASSSRTGVYDAKDVAYSLGYGRSTGAWRWGFNAKQATESLAGRSARVTAADAGFIVRPPSWPISLAGSLRNAGGKASFGPEETPLPRALELGVGARLLDGALLMAVQSERPADGDGALAAGAEFWAHNVLALRAGWRGGEKAGNGLSLGLGLKLRELTVDYAFAGQGDGFPPSHRMGLSWRFGGAGERSYEEGLRHLQAGRPAEAVLKFQEAIDADPGHDRAVRALREAVKRMDQQMREDELPGEER